MAKTTLEYDMLVIIGELLYKAKIIPAPPVGIQETERLRHQELKEKTDEQARMKRILEEVKVGSGFAYHQLIDNANKAKQQ